jgi:peptidyl-tRNA hydrolase
VNQLPTTAFSVPAAPKRVIFPQKATSKGKKTSDLGKSFARASADFTEGASAVMQHISRSRREKQLFEEQILSQQQKILDLQSELLAVQQRLAEEGMLHRAHSSILQSELKASKSLSKSGEFNKLADEVIRLRTELDRTSSRLLRGCPQ